MESETTMREMLAQMMVEMADRGDTPEPPAGLRDRLMARVEASQNYTLRTDEGDWLASSLKGIKVKVLSIDRARHSATLLIRAEAGAVYPPHRHTGGEDCYVVSGELHVAGQVLHAGDFHRAEADSDHGELYTPTGAEVLLVVAAADFL
jgi:anti-sigma factor ChrR (cupin superfamily)